MKSKWFSILISVSLVVSGCGDQGAFRSVPPAAVKVAVENPAATGFQNPNSDNYSVDGDSARVTAAKEQLLSGLDSGSPAEQQLAEANLAFATTIQKVDLKRFNSKNEASRWGKSRFELEILSDDPQTQMAPLIFKGEFVKEGMLLKIQKTTPASGVSNYSVTGVFQDVPEKGKIFGNLELTAHNADGSIRAVSKINLRTYLATVRVRTPRDRKESTAIDQQISALESSVAWVSNTVVVLGRSFYKYDVIQYDKLKNSQLDDADTESLVQIKGESLQTTGFVTSPVTSITVKPESDLQASQAALFGADDEGTRTFQVDLKDQESTQDVMVEFRENEVVNDEELDPAVRGDVRPAPSEEPEANTESEETEDEPAEDVPEETTTAPEATQSDANYVRPESPVGELPKDESPDSMTSSPRPPARPAPTNAATDTAPPKEYDPIDHYITNPYSVLVDPQPEPIRDEKEDESSDEPGFFSSLWDYVFGEDEEAQPESPVHEGKEADDQNVGLVETSPRPMARPESVNPSETSKAVEAAPDAAATESEAESSALETSLRPRPRPANLGQKPPSNPRPRRNQPDIEIEGIHFGLSEDAFLKINYDAKNRPQVAKGLYDMEEHYAYPDIRNKWIPHIRDKKGSLVSKFWKHAYPVRDLISQVFEHYDVLPTLAYVTILESTFLRDGKFTIQLNETGESTAYGPFQLLRGTAKVLGLRTDTSQGKGAKPASWDERNWFVPSLCGAAKHFKESLEHFGHADTTWAILAYHAGDRGASDEIARSLGVGQSELWRNISRYNYTYQDIKSYNKFKKKYVDYVDQKIAAYFVLQSPSKMSFEPPRDVVQEIPAGHRHKFFPAEAIKDSNCEEAAKGWRPYFEGRAS